MYRTPDRHRQQQQRRRRHERKSAYQVLAETCRPVVESLEPRQLMAGYSVDRVSVAEDGSAPTAASGTPSVSADGSRVAFTSVAPLTSAVGGGNALSLVYVRKGGHTILVSKTPGGSVPDGGAAEPMISANGKFVVYSSAATDIVGGDTNGQSDIFLYDVDNDTTTRLAVGTSPTISADGRYVAFQSSDATLVAGDNNGVADVFVIDTTDMSVRRISTTEGGAEGNQASSGPVISPDGRYVAYLSDATNLVPGSDTNNVADVFLKDLQGGSVQRVSAGVSGVLANGTSGRIALAVSQQNGVDHVFVAFESDASNLVAGDTNGLTDVFLRDVFNNTTRRISVGTASAQADGASTKPTISADGRFVAYTSAATNLVAGDGNGKADVFLYDNSVQSTRRVSTGPNGAEASGDSDDAAISGDGRFIAFRSTAENLLANGADQNLLADVFLKDRLAAPQAGVTGTPDGSSPQPIPAGDTTPATADGTDFGIVDVGDADGLDHTFTITNTGSDRLIFSGTPLVRISGANAADFVVTAQPTSPLDPGGSTTFVVRFKPGGVGIRTATVTITSNDGTTPTYTFDLSGAAIDASVTSRMVVTQGTTAVGTGSGATAFNFGNLERNTSPLTRTFTITNVSGQTILLDPASLAAASGFEIASQFDTPATPAPVQLAPGHSATFVLRMLSATAGPASATINLSNTVLNTTDTQATTFAVSGTVVVPAAIVLLNGQTLANGQAVDYGPVVKGGSPVFKIFTIRNDGPDVLTLGTLSLPAGYTLQSGFPTTIQPGATINFTVQLDSSTAVGAKNGTLSFTTSDPLRNPFTLTLTGSVTTPGISITVDGTPIVSGSTVTNFGTGVQGLTVPTKTFTVTNTGTAPLTVSIDPRLLPAGFTLVSAPASPIAVGATATFVLGLSTAAVGAPTGSVTISTNASVTTGTSTGNTFSLRVAGTVIPNAPKATILLGGTAVGGQAISFGTVPQGTTPVKKVITIRNDGVQPLLLGAITLPAGYAVDAAPGSSTVAPGATTTFTVSFTPVVAGSQTGVLLVATNEAGRTAVSAGITASVTAASRTALAVDSVALARVPAIVLSGTKSARGTATVTLRNYSSATVAGSYKVTVYAAAGSFARPGVDKVLGTANAKVNLKAHAKSGYAVKLSFPAPPADGAYSIVAVVTGPGADPAFNFNRAPFKVRIEKAQAKLGATGGAAPIAGSLGQKITQTVMLSNSGNRALSGTITGDLYLSKDGTLDGAAKITRLSGLKVNVASHKAQRVRLSFKLPKAAPAGIAAKGKYTLVFKITKLASSTPNILNKDGVVPAGRITLT